MASATTPTKKADRIVGDNDSYSARLTLSQIKATQTLSLETYVHNAFKATTLMNFINNMNNGVIVVSESGKRLVVDRSIKSPNKSLLGDVTLSNVHEKLERIEYDVSLSAETLDLLMTEFYFPTVGTRVDTQLQPRRKDLPTSNEEFLCFVSFNFSTLQINEMIDNLNRYVMVAKVASSHSDAIAHSTFSGPFQRSDVAGILGYGLPEVTMDDVLRVIRCRLENAHLFEAKDSMKLSLNNSTFWKLASLVCPKILYTTTCDQAEHILQQVANLRVDRTAFEWSA